MPIQIKAFQCEFCGKFHRKTKKAVQTHEKNCFWNPVRRACMSCGWREFEETTVYDPHHGGNPGSSDYEVTRQYCCSEDAGFRELTKDQLKHNCPHWKPIEK